MTTVAMNDLNI